MDSRSPLPAAWRKRVERLRRGAEAIGVLLFAAMFVTFIVQVVMRYVFNRPLAWSDELSLVLYPWAIFWAAAFCVRFREHVTFDLFYSAATAPRRRLLLALTMLGLAGLFLAPLPAVVEFVAFMARERTPVLGWSYGLVFLCFPLFLLAVALRALLRLRWLAGRDWRRHVGAHAATHAEEPVE